MKMTQDNLKALVREVAGEVFAERMEENQAKGAEANAKGGAQIINFADFAKALGGRSDAGGYQREAQPGDRFLRSLGAVVLSSPRGGHGNPADAKAWAEKDGRFKAYAHLQKDLSSVLEEGGALLVREELSDDFIEFLRDAQVLAGLGARDIPMSSTELAIPAHTLGSTGGWVGEGDPIKVTAPGFGMVKLTLQTYASIVPIPNDLLRHAFINAEAFVGADLRLDIGSAFDIAHLRGSGQNGQPRGVRWRGQSTQSSGDTLDDVVADLVACFTRMGEASMPMQRIGWGFSWRVWQKLFTLRETGDSRFMFKDEMSQGTLLGAPFRRSGAIKNNYDPYSSGQANKTELYCFDLDTVLIGRGDGIQFDSEPGAAYETDTGVKSAYSRNQTVVRVIAKTAVNVRYKDGVQIVDGINWIN